MPRVSPFAGFVLLGFSLVVSSCASRVAAKSIPADKIALTVEKAELPYQILDARSGRQIETSQFFQGLRSARAVCVGEAHDDPHHHWAQLVVLKEVAGQGAPFATGMEMFQRPYQGVLDDFAQGKISEDDLLTRSDWRRRWSYDWELYAPMVRFTVKGGGQVLALNVSKELKDRWKKVGLEGLSEDDRAKFPELNLNDEEHRRWFRELMESMTADSGEHGNHAFFEQDGLPPGHPPLPSPHGKPKPKAKPPQKGSMPEGHGKKGKMPKDAVHGAGDDGAADASESEEPELPPDHGKGKEIPDDDVHAHLKGGVAPSGDPIDTIYPVQVLWDETMADTAARWLSEDPARRIVILAGNGHCHDSAIVRRMQRRGIEGVVSVRPVIETGAGQTADLLAKPQNDYLFVMKRE